MSRKRYLIAGVAGLALTAPVSADKGGHGNDKAPPATAQQGGGQQAKQPQREERQQEQRVERPQGHERQQEQRGERQERHQEQRIERAQRVERPQRIERQQQRAERQQRIERPQRVERQQQHIERQQQRAERPQRIEHQKRVERQQQRAERSQRVDQHAQRTERNEVLRPQKLERQQQRSERHLTEQMFASHESDRTASRTAVFDGRGYRPAAPLLSSHDMRPMKPFKAKFDKLQSFSIGDRVQDVSYLAVVPALYSGSYVDTNDYYHRYDNDLGYVYRIDRDDGIVSSLFPLFGGYGIGDPWPATYYSSYVPIGYQDYYYDTPDYYYRNDGYGIYQVDSSTQLITALVSLVLGQGYGVGQVLPASYGVYNVPLDYRANYYDTDDRSYRYGDGFIYQVDPYSRRVAARYPIYSDDYYVGDPWPVAYPDYNVPYGYRSAYYDTPQDQYRYANGGIYQVDPTSQIIRALVALVSGDQFAVGQQLPSGYETYNVPFDYRDRYADSDRDWYRYANGSVYRVDAGSGLIEDAYPIYG